MQCHECLMVGSEQTSVALCRFCGAALCKRHLVALYVHRIPFLNSAVTTRHQRLLLCARRSVL